MIMTMAATFLCRFCIHLPLYFNHLLTPFGTLEGFDIGKALHTKIQLIVMHTLDFQRKSHSFYTQSNLEDPAPTPFHGSNIYTTVTLLPAMLNANKACFKQC